MTGATTAREIRTVLLRAGRVRTELGVFVVRSFRACRGWNTHTGATIVVPARHQVLLLARPAFVTDVLGVADDAVEPLADDDEIPFVPWGRAYGLVVEELRRAPVTAVPDELEASEVEPASCIPLADLGELAVYRGVRGSTIMFRPSESLVEAIADRSTRAPTS